VEEKEAALREPTGIRNPPFDMSESLDVPCFSDVNESSNGLGQACQHFAGINEESVDAWQRLNVEA
jgi:hypothetical protein